MNIPCWAALLDCSPSDDDLKAWVILCNLYLVIPSSLKWASKMSWKIKRKKASMRDFSLLGQNMVTWAQPNGKEARKRSLLMYTGRKWPDVVGSFWWSALEFLNPQTRDVKRVSLWEFLWPFANEYLCECRIWSRICIHYSVQPGWKADSCHLFMCWKQS